MKKEIIEAIIKDFQENKQNFITINCSDGKLFGQKPLDQTNTQELTLIDDEILLCRTDINTYYIKIETINNITLKNKLL